MAKPKKTPVIWRVSDGRAGHDTQSKGLIKALNSIKPCYCHDIKLADGKPSLLDFFLKKFPAPKELPDPDIIVGAGRGTHLPLLCAKRSRGGKTIVIMKPSIPASCFDFCFIPEYDNPRMADNIVVTKGMINNIIPSVEQINNRGLILIGGPSKHFHWDSKHTIQQIKEILTTHIDVQWEISDSARTPHATSNLLKTLHESNAEYKNYSGTGSGWVARQLSLVTNVWVSMDNISMIYESLTSGAAVGLLDVPTKNTSKLSNNIASLVEEKMVTPYSKWFVERTLNKPITVLNEAKRCAERLHEAGFLS